MPDKIQKLMAEAEEISAAPTSPVSALLYVLCLPLSRSALHSSFKVICDIWLPCSGAAQSAFLCFLLFQLSDTIDSSFAAKQAPTQFVAKKHHPHCPRDCQGSLLPVHLHLWHELPGHDRYAATLSMMPLLDLVVYIHVNGGP